MNVKCFIEWKRLVFALPLSFTQFRLHDQVSLKEHHTLNFRRKYIEKELTITKEELTRFYLEFRKTEYRLKIQVYTTQYKMIKNEHVEIFQRERND